MSVRGEKCFGANIWCSSNIYQQGQTEAVLTSQILSPGDSNNNVKLHFIFWDIILLIQSYGINQMVSPQGSECTRNPVWTVTHNFMKIGSGETWGEEMRFPQSVTG